VRGKERQEIPRGAIGRPMCEGDRWKVIDDEEREQRIKDLEKKVKRQIEALRLLHNRGSSHVTDPFRCNSLLEWKKESFLVHRRSDSVFRESRDLDR
jgi:allophanate hydrolase subunit 2